MAQENSKKTKKLTIYDPEDQTNYNLVLEEKDYLRAQSDEIFLNALLQHAKTNAVSDDECDDNPFEFENDVNMTQESLNRDQSKENSSNNPCHGTEPLSSTSNQTNKGGNVWDFTQTKALIKIMSTHIGDLNNVKKRKFVFENIANDLLSQGYSVTAVAAQNKWKSLVRSYQKCKDVKTRTGQGPSRFYFFDEMDEVLGLKPTNECSHSLNSNFNTESETLEKTPLNASCSDNTNTPLQEMRSQNYKLKRSLWQQKQNTCKKKLRNMMTERYDIKKKWIWKKKISDRRKKIELLNTLINNTPNKNTRPFSISNIH